MTASTPASASHAPPQNLFERFEAMARTQPEAPAIVLSDRVLSYAQMNAQADAVAACLTARGVRAEEAVGVLVERSGWLPAVFVGILKAGACYVPLVASLPAERLANSARQADIRIVVALDGLPVPTALADLPGLVVLRPEELPLANASANQPTEVNAPAARPAVAPTRLAAILFTSGSTGEPKGVMLQHDACVHMAQGHIDVQRITAADRMLLAGTPSFILGFRELCTPMVAGAAYVPIDRATLDDPARVVATMETRGVTIAMFTPSYLRLFEGTVPQGLRLLMTAGERPNVDDARHYASHLEYWNIHGATEVCGTICMHRVDPRGDGPIPSGRPFPDTEVFILDENGAEVAPGETGLIHVASVGVARGYLNQTALTAETFVQTPRGRAYRSHDVGRFNADGDLEALGRDSDLVKVSGQAVSLGEIEATLLHHEGVHRAAVVQHHGALVAFVEGDPSRLEAETDWAGFLGRTLPGYMIPARVQVLAHMPISTAGKADRTALLALAEQHAQARASDSQATSLTPLEAEIASVWRDTLQAATVRRDDPFFALGGTSLLAIRVSQRLQTLGHAVTVRDVLATGTVRALAARIEEIGHEAGATPGAFESDKASVGQRDFWVGESLGLGAEARIVRVLEARGEVPDAARWQDAWTLLIARHAALRARFWADTSGEVRWTAESLDALGDAARLRVEGCPTAEEARRRLRVHAEVPLPLDRAPLARAGLLRIATGETVFWMVLHHAVIDGVSAAQLQTDLTELLNARALPAPVDGMALASVDEQRYLASTRAETDRAYWRDTLDGLLDVDEGVAFEPLHTDFIRAMKPTGAPAPRLTERLDAATARALEQLARRQHVGLHALMVGLFSAEMRRRTGRAAALLATALTHRPAGAEHAAGYFTNVVPLALHPAGQSLQDHLRAAHDAVTRAVAHVAYPSSRAVQELRQRHPDVLPPSRQLPYEIAVTANPTRETREGELALAPWRDTDEAVRPAAGLSMSFSHEPVGDEIELALVFDADLFDETTARAWLDGFAEMARWVAADASRLAQAPPTLWPAEQARLASWEQGRKVNRPAKRFEEIVEDLARAHPQRLAVVTTTRQIRYGELDAQADMIARHLRDAGVRRGDVVAVLTDCCADLVAAMVGVMKAGGAYLPLALDLPPQRQAFMIDDSGARVLLVVGDVPVDAALAAAATTVLRDADCVADTACSPLPHGDERGTIDDVAYVIYTSGSTGTPKGVTVPHAGTVNTLLATGDDLAVTADDRVGWAATPSFDASILEVGLGLLNGLAVVPVSKDERNDPWTLKQTYHQLGVTICFQVPSYLRVSEETPFTGMRVVMVGGEAPTHRDVRHVGGRAAFYHMYGPTEASIVTGGEIIDAAMPVHVPLTLGPPMTNVALTFRDPDGQRVPPGEVGELWIGGVGLATGYLNRPDLTDKAFVHTGEGRFYRTGDRGCWAPGGRLRVLGRKDHQIKLHGQRVELGEIEQALLAHEAVAQTVVLVQSAPDGTKTLRAFARLQPQAAAPSPQGWADFLSQCLPRHMIPPTVLAVPALPHTPAGKIDGAALLALCDDSAAEAAARTPPHPGLETEIAAVWESLLGHAVHREDSFFALGGNSLMAVTSAHRLSQVLGRAVPARTVFTTPTLAAYAAQISQREEDIVVQSTDTDRVTEGELEYWVFQQQGDDTRGHVIPIYCVVAPGPAASDEEDGGIPPVARWEQAWSTLVARHELLRTYYVEGPDRIVRRGLADDVPVRIESATQPDLAAAVAHVRRHHARPFDLRQAPLWRIGLVKAEAENRTLFWLAMNHATGDGTSAGILLEELQMLLRGEPLPALTSTYRRTVAREEAYLASETGRADARFWDEKLTSMPPEGYADWRHDAPRGAATTSDGTPAGCHRFWTAIDAVTAERLRDVARAQGVGLHALFTALFATVAAYRGGRTRFFLGTPVDTRQAEQARVVGYHVNYLPLSMHVELGHTFRDTLQQVQATLSEALQHAEYPFPRMYPALFERRPETQQPHRYPLVDLIVTENPVALAEPSGFHLAPPTMVDAYERVPWPHDEDMIVLHEAAPDGGLLLRLHANDPLYSKTRAAAWFGALVDAVRWLAQDAGRVEATLREMMRSSVHVPRMVTKMRDMARRVGEFAVSPLPTTELLDVMAVLGSRFGTTTDVAALVPRDDEADIRKALKQASPHLARLASDLQFALEYDYSAMFFQNLGLQPFDIATRSFLLYAFALCMGKPTATDQVDRRIVWDIKVRKDKVQTGTATTFSEHANEATLHTDNQFARHPERYFLLYFIHAADDHGGVSFLRDLRDLEESLGETEEGRWALDFLRTTPLPFRVPGVFTKSGTSSDVEVAIAPIFGTHMHARYRLDTLEAGLMARPDLDSPDVRRALAILEAELHDERKLLQFFMPDDGLVLFNNHEVFHGRTEFKDAERHALRIRFSALDDED